MVYLLNSKPGGLAANRAQVYPEPPLRVVSGKVELMLKQAYCPEFRTVQCAFKDLMIHGFCNSHYLSHFAAFFIVARA
jgi:hypothetical protein